MNSLESTCKYFFRDLIGGDTSKNHFEDATCSEMRKQTAQTKRVYFISQFNMIPNASNTCALLM